MPSDIDLTHEHLTLIAHKLDILIGNETNRHPDRDYPKAAVLFHSINNLGFNFNSETLDKVFKISTKKYADNLKKDLKNLALYLTFLSDGLSNPIHKEWEITRAELAR